MATAGGDFGCGDISSHDKAILNRVFNPNLPYDDLEEDEELLDSDQEIGDESPVLKQVKSLEVEGVQLAETGDLHAALEKLNNAINLMPGRASGYNNRAQALRLKGDTQGAYDDLNKAVELSGGQGVAARQALTQRALIKKLEGNTDGAIEDFQFAAALGSSFAKQQLVALNPFAALCNQMLSEVFTKLQKGEET